MGHSLDSVLGYAHIVYFPRRTNSMKFTIQCKWLLSGMVLILPLLILSIGCGGGGAQEGTVTGKITLDGKPLPAEPRPHIYLQGTDAGGGTAIIDASGNYTLKNVRYGEFKVFFKGPFPSTPGAPTPVLDIPKKYTSVDSTDITLTVDKKKVTFTYDIKSDE